MLHHLLPGGDTDKCGLGKKKSLYTVLRTFMIHKVCIVGVMATIKRRILHRGPLFEAFSASRQAQRGLNQKNEEDLEKRSSIVVAFFVVVCN